MEQPPRLVRAPRRRPFPWVAVLGSVLLAGCAADGTGRPVELGFGPSVLPNLGLSGSVALRVREGTRVSTWIETELTSQFLDDADLADDGNPGAGNWTQLRAGAKFTLPYGERHYATARTGLHWFDARGEPNIIDDPGHYYGTYFGLGFETRVTEHLAMGPELALLPSFATGGGTGHLVPQLAWRILWRL